MLIDDLVDTAGTLCHAATALKGAGAKKVLAYITHPVLSGPAIERIAKSELDELVVTDTIPLREDAKQLPEDPSADRRGPAGGDDAPHSGRRERELAVHRLIAWD